MTTTPVTVGLAGTHHTGKTTLARRIEMELRGLGYTVTRTSGLARRAADLGFPKMLNHTVASTEWIMAAGAADALAAGIGADVVLMDRTPHDALAYLLAARDLRSELTDGAELEVLGLLADIHTRHHTLLIATVLDPALPLGEHPRKDPAYLDQTFRAAVDEHLHHLVADGEVKDRLLPAPSDSADLVVASAVATITSTLEAAK
ncbi:hypothetical protein ACIA8O_36980 [Kitasatospora sp. NPDC051853]|uniref:hypothetical protein n=1 Tax=Kitasatospora sp. NPDC051853 TaxID=3364058 RepID=UPI00379508E2